MIETKIKLCSKCKQKKSLSEFYRNKQRKDGYNGWCKKCLTPAINRHKQSERYKEQQAEYSKKLEVKERMNYMRRKRRKENPEKYRAIDRMQRQNDDPQKLKARDVVGQAIIYHNFPKACKHQCKNCENQASEYHHWSYDPEHWLDVIPLCKQCHADVHNGV